MLVRKGASGLGESLMGMNLKRLAAARAVEWVEDGMVLGLGTGSTASYAIELIGQHLRGGRLRDIVGVPTSARTAELATQCCIPLSTLQEHVAIDLTIDGADEVDPCLNLTKGGGGALLHEKIVARASRREIIIVDDSKLVSALGTRMPLPVEVIPFGWGSYLPALSRLGCDPVLRMQTDEEPLRTDEGNYIVDCHFPQIDDPRRLECELNLIPGVVENGLFIGLASLVVVASESGVRELGPS
jgi:ribose 5-phosphate isomerase A